MRRTVLLLIAVLLALPAFAQQQQEEEKPRREWPAGWKMRLDRPNPHGRREGVAFWVMKPGWHITTGPACILYDPEQTADGEYRVVVETFLFDPGERREGFGVFFGGQDLAADAQSYFYFLIRRDGRFLIKRRDGAQTTVLVDWTEHPAIVKYESGKTSVKNVLAVEAGAETVRFFVNSAEVASLPRTELRAEGVVGLRINHSVNVHVSEFHITKAGA